MYWQRIMNVYRITGRSVAHMISCSSASESLGGIPFRWNLLIFGCLEQGWAVVSQPSPTRAIDPMVEGPRWLSLLRRKFRKVRFSRTNSDLSAQSAHRVPGPRLGPRDAAVLPEVTPDGEEGSTSAAAAAASDAGS